MDVGEQLIQKAVRKLSWRQRYQTAMRWTLTALLTSTLALGIAVAAYQMWWIASDWVATAAWIGGGIVITTLLMALIRMPDSIALAERLDTANGLHDRLGTALDILQRPADQRTEFEAAQIRDAIQYTANIDITAAAPWVFPKELLGVLIALVLLAAATQIHMPPPVQTNIGIEPVLLGQIASFTVPDPSSDPAPENVEEDDIRQEAETQLGDIAANESELTLNDEDAIEVMSKMNRALSELAKRPDEVDPRTLTNAVNEAEEAIEELAGEPRQQAAEEAVEEKLEKLSEALEKKAAKTLRDPKITELMKDLSASLKARDYETAAQKIEALLKRFNELPRRERERLAKLFDALGKKFESQIQRDMNRLRKKRDRLRKKQEQNGELSKRERRRLKTSEKELDRLQRQQNQEQPKAQKQLDRLSKEMQQLAQKMRRQQPRDKKRGARQNQSDGPEQKKNRLDKRSAKELSEMLKRMAKRRKQRRAGQKMKMKMADMKELLQRRRRRMKRGRKRLEKLAKKRGTSAGGEKPQAGMEPGQKSGDKNGLLYRQRKEARQNWTRRRNDSDNGAGRTRRQMLSGKETDIKAKTLEDFVEGKEGKGASTKEILYGAAQKGSRVKGYGKVHIDYSMRASRQMEEEKIPPGYREYVEEYFRLIRTR